MFATLTQRLLLGLFVFLILSIPVGAYLVSQNQTIKSNASEPKPKLATITPGSTTSPAKELLKSSQTLPSNSPSPSAEPSLSDSPTIATSVGPTLSLKTKLEGRVEGNQITRLFVGIMEGSLVANPKFLLNFTLDLPASGEYGNLSLAGLNPGSQYTALLKGSAQIATSSAFIMSPTTTNLNNGEALNMLSGDLNDDNVINAADYSIAKSAFGAIEGSSNWNANVDLNKDGVINVIDLSIISKNLGQIGASGVWTSPVPIATQSGAISPNVSESSPSGGPATGGYWLWIPAGF